MKYYAVRRGFHPGIFTTWKECQRSTSGYSGAQFKSFSTREEAQAYLDEGKSQRKTKERFQNCNKIPDGISYAFVDGSYNDFTMVYGYGGFLHVESLDIPFQGNGDDLELLPMRNVAGEILGCMHVVQLAIQMKIPELVIYYDYEGIEKWATGEWKRNKTGTKEYYAKMQEWKTQIKLHFVHVKGHSGNAGNEYADKLAKEAVGL